MSALSDVIEIDKILGIVIFLPISKYRPIVTVDRAQLKQIDT